MAERRRFPIRQWEGREPAPRATAYWVEVKRPRQRRWEVIYRRNDLDRALAYAVKFARINTELDVRVWDFHAMKPIWEGRGAEAKVEQWKERRPPGMVGANKNRRGARHNRREYVVATHRGVPVYISSAITAPDRAKALQRAIRQDGYAATIISHDRLLAAETKMQRGEKFRARSPYSRRNAGNGAGRRSARIYKYEGKQRVSARIRSRQDPSAEDVFWWKQGTATYVLVENPKGEYTYGGRRVDLVSIHGSGEIRWVSPAPDGGGTAAAVKHFGLQKAARNNRGRACPNPSHRHRCASNIPRGWKKGSMGQYVKERCGHIAVVGPHMSLSGRFAYLVVRKSDGLRKAWGDSGKLGEVFRAAEAALPGGWSNPKRKARRTRHAGLSGLMGNSEIKRLERYA